MNSSRQKRLDKAQLRCLFQVPFFAPGVAKLPVEFVAEAEYRARFCGEPDQMPTACTDGERLYWCSEWFDSLPDQVLVTLLCHEVCHCLLGHIWRLPPPGGDHGIANEAADHAVNLMMKEFSGLVTAKRLADPFPFPTDAAGKSVGLMDPQYAGMAEESIYAKIAASRPPRGGRPGGQVKAGGANGGGGASRQPAGGKNAPNANVGSNSGGQKIPSFGQFQPGKGSAASQKALKNDWEGALIQSVAAMQGRGDLPAGLDRLVNKLVSVQVNWWDVLRSWLREQCADDWDFMAPAMEYSDGPFILPSLKSEKCGAVVFATDTSGSIDHEMLARFQAEKQSCLDDMRPRRLLDIYCDAKVHAVREYEPGDDIKRDCPGGGGTSFIPIWAEVEKRGVVPRCLVLLTDMDGDWGADPGYPVVIVTWTGGGKAPFGEVIYAGLD